MALFASLNCFLKWVFLQCSRVEYSREIGISETNLLIGGASGRYPRSPIPQWLAKCPEVHLLTCMPRNVTRCRSTLTDCIPGLHGGSATRSFVFTHAFWPVICLESALFRALTLTFKSTRPHIPIFGTKIVSFGESESRRLSDSPMKGVFF